MLRRPPPPLLRSSPRLLLPSLAPLLTPPPPPPPPPCCSYRCSLPPSALHPSPHIPKFPAVMGEAASPSPPQGGCLLILCGKSPEEDAQAQSLASRNCLQLLPSGEEATISVHFRGEGAPSTMGFRVQDYMRGLFTNRFGRFLAWSPRLPSTHDLVSKNFRDLPLGAVCVADSQFKGRGRSGNIWESPSGCLMFSFTLEMEDGRAVPLVQYIVSLAVTEAIKSLCKVKELPNLNVRIKWPNDLYLNGLKVGGILCTSTYRSKKFDVSAGVGLNLDNEKPTTCLNAVLKDIHSTSYGFQREELLASFFNNFEHLFQTFLDKGFVVLEELYYKTWLHSGQKVTLEEKEEGRVREMAVIIQGLAPSGYLLATDEYNNAYELHPDGNSFDFFKGLAKRKLG